MILVLLGTQNNSFHRLLEEIDRLIDKKIIKEKVIVQAGYTKYKSKNMEIFDLISKEKLDKLKREASLIISHGGVGSIISCLEKNKIVIAVPRLSKYQEHVNDHQLNIVEKYSSDKYIIGCNDVSNLEEAIKKVPKFIPKKFISNNKKILKIIEDFIDED